MPKRNHICQNMYTVNYSCVLFDFPSAFHVTNQLLFSHIYSVAKTYFIESIILYFGKVKELYFIYTLFQSNTLKILYYRIKLS